MTECPILQYNLLTIIPGNISIENFIPGRVYRKTLKLENKSKIPLIVNLRVSDKSKLLIDKTLLRIEKGTSQTINLVIQDKIKYSNKLLPTKPKKLYIYFEGELIDYKYEINLMYFCNSNTLSKFNYLNQKYQAKNYYKTYNSQKEVPSIFLSKYQNLNSARPKRLQMDNICNILIKSSDTKEALSLKKKVNNLMAQLENMKKDAYNNIDDSKKGDKNFEKKNYDSFFIINNNIYDEKFKIEENLDINSALVKNKILTLENEILNKRITMLEEKIKQFNEYGNKIDFDQYELIGKNNIDYEEKEEAEEEEKKFELDNNENNVGYEEEFLGNEEEQENNDENY